MGVIDELWFKIACPVCDTTEILKVLDRGSSWGGSHWATPKSAGSFMISVRGGGAEVPTITAARCSACGSDATIESSYSGFSPEAET